MILFLSDLHFGSKYGPWPDGDAAAKKKVAFLRKLIDTKDLRKGFSLVLCGDLIDGGQSKSQGIGVYTADFGEQVKVMAETIAPLCKAASKIIRVWGTPYHEGHGSETSDLMDFRLGSGKVLSGQVIMANLDGAKWDIAHHPCRKSVTYKGSACDAECIECRKAQIECDWVVRGHLHFYGQWITAHGPKVVFLPCLQGKTPYMVKNNPNNHPDLGACLWSDGQIIYLPFEE